MGREAIWVRGRGANYMAKVERRTALRLTGRPRASLGEWRIRWSRNALAGIELTPKAICMSCHSQNLLPTSALRRSDPGTEDHQRSDLSGCQEAEVWVSVRFV